MNRSHQLIIAGCAISSLITFLLARDPDLRIPAWVVGILAAFQILGLLLIACGQLRLGSRIVMFASLLIIPAGLPGAIGARRLLDAAELAEFADSANPRNYK